MMLLELKDLGHQGTMDHTLISKTNALETFKKRDEYTKGRDSWVAQ